MAIRCSKRRAATVTEFDTPELHKLIEDMFESMYAARGVWTGRAADRNFAADRGHRYLERRRSDREDRSDQSGDYEGRRHADGEEGCLSIPGFREQVTRGKRVTVQAQNVKGEWFEMTGEDLLARAFLHETDHLNGTLYISHVSVLKRDLIKRKIRKLAKAGEWA